MKEYYLGVDIGTSKTKVCICQESMDGRIEVLGIGESNSEGVVRGNIVNIEKASKPLISAVADAEKIARVEAKNAFLVVGGDRLKTISSRGVAAIPANKESVDTSDIAEVLQAARAIVIPDEESIIESVVREFMIDGQGGIKDAVGMSGVRMEADVGILVAPRVVLNNLERTLERAGLIPDGQGVAIRGGGFSVLTPDEAEIGVSVLDIGAGTTELSVFKQGDMIWATSFGYAGLSVTKDLSVGLSLPVEMAESIKLEYGCAVEKLVNENETVEIPGIGGREPRTIPRKIIAQIMEPRLEEILEISKEKISEAGLLEKLSAGLVITGGTTRTDSLIGLAERVFKLPVRIGLPNLPGEMMDIAKKPEFSVAIGSVLLASERRHRGDFEKSDNGFWEKVRKWFLGKV